MVVHTKKSDVPLALEFQKHLFNESHKHGIKEDGRHKKTSSKQKWTNRYYHVQNSKDVDHQYLKMYCEKTVSWIEVSWSTQQTTWCMRVM